MGNLAVVNADAVLEAMKEINELSTDIIEKAKALLSAYDKIGEKTNLTYVKSLSEFVNGTVEQLEEAAEITSQVRQAANRYLDQVDDLDARDEAIFND